MLCAMMVSGWVASLHLPCHSSMAAPSLRAEIRLSCLQS